ncbi:MAG: hypothetical protein NC904_08770 [Candidatus Omnitrophica bacterium]|nr:hypothetical protein [Candidatus Omnitrophota bacterium]
MEIKYKNEWIPEYDIVQNDIIKFYEEVYERVGNKYKYRFLRYIKALVVNESYGKKRMQHTFTLKVIDSDYYNSGTIIMRRGRNIYSNDPKRLLWEDENLRSKYIMLKREKKNKVKEEYEKRKEKLIWQT